MTYFVRKRLMVVFIGDGHCWIEPVPASSLGLSLLKQNRLGDWWRDSLQNRSDWFFFFRHHSRTMIGRRSLTSSSNAPSLDSENSQLSPMENPWHEVAAGKKSFQGFSCCCCCCGCCCKFGGVAAVLMLFCLVSSSVAFASFSFSISQLPQHIFWPLLLLYCLLSLVSVRLFVV